MKKLLLKILPPSIKKALNKIYLKYYFRNNLAVIDETTFLKILTQSFKLEKGDVLLIHSAMSKVKFSFPKEKLIELIFSVIGPEGTIILPCWDIETNAKVFLTENPDYVFDVVNTPTKLGSLPENVRKMPGAYRSANPINSVVGYGKHAKELLEEHHLDILPCGKKSPFFKMMKYKSKIIGLGVDFRYLTFAHCVEDCNEFKFPLETRYDEIFKVNVRFDPDDIKKIETKVAHQRISHRDVPHFFEQNIDKSIANLIKVNNSLFFVADAKQLYKKMGELAENNITIYTAKAFE